MTPEYREARMDGTYGRPLMLDYLTALPWTRVAANYTRFLPFQLVHGCMAATVGKGDGRVSKSIPRSPPNFRPPSGGLFCS